MRIKANGERYFMDESLQRQAEIADGAGNFAPTPRQMLLTHSKQYLGYLDWFAQPCGIAEALPVVTARAALRLLIEFLERTR